MVKSSGRCQISNWLRHDGLNVLAIAPERSAGFSDAAIVSVPAIGR
jgi:hypothetical protein